MVLQGKQKAVATFVITLVLGIIGTLLAFSGLPVDVKPFLDLAVAIITVIGSTLGVYQTTNSNGTVPDPVDDTPVTVTDETPATGQVPSTTDAGITDPATPAVGGDV